MEILWLAIVFYSVGLAVVLHIRPALMFHENGTWKEFGYHRDSRHTMFPFWLFAVVWAFVSYALAAASSWTFLSAAAAIPAYLSEAPTWNEESEEEQEEQVPIQEEDEEQDLQEIPVSKRQKKPRPGYYVLNSSSNSGLRKYIYYGTKPPN